MKTKVASLHELILGAQSEKKAIGHFNISNMEGFWAVVLGAKELGVPVIIGVSEGERDFIGLNEIAAVVKSYRQRTHQPVFLNADHTYSFEKIVEAVDAGCDAVIIDGSALPTDENISMTRKSLSYAKSKNPEILVEGEIGFIGKSSKVLKAIPEGVKIGLEFLTTGLQAKEFIAATGVDLLAPSVGNIHGMLEGGRDPALNIPRVAEIREAAGVPLVLHGASGNSAAEITESINAGVVIVHINTELRVAYRSGLVKSIQENPDEVAPYKYLKGARSAMQKVVEDKLKIFNKLL